MSLLFLALLACNPDSPDCESSEAQRVCDEDGDGWYAIGCVVPSLDGLVCNGTDCDDGNPDVFTAYDETGAAVCRDWSNVDGGTWSPGTGNGNGGSDTAVDDTGLVDTGIEPEEDPCEGDETAWYYDGDADGFGNEDDLVCLVEQPIGYVDNADDCDDANGDIHPDAIEVCDGVDNDCDTLIDDEDDNREGGTVFFNDLDADGYGDVNNFTQACDQPEGTVEDHSDCDDTDADVNPEGTEYCDDIDNDCNGSVDDDALDADRFYLDDDVDGYGNVDDSVDSCESEVTSYVDNADDCDDANGDIHPDAIEVCDDADNDCDGTIDNDDALDASTWYADADEDGYGDSTSSTTACDEPWGYVTDDQDCDDTDADVYPTATEVCDSVDNDCDGDVDDDDSNRSGGDLYFVDDDSDGYGDVGSYGLYCTQPSGYVSDYSDCDDTDGSIYPGATETCDGEDDDCDSDIDEGVMTTYYADVDSDGEGDASSTSESCSAPAGYVNDDQDCDDNDATVNTSGTEVCDSVDNDCDGTVDNDDAVDADTWYLDSDSDGYGVSTSTTKACDEPSGYADNADDCDDGDSAISPAATEVTGDEVDQDCDGTEMCYFDGDGDGYRDSSGSTIVSLDSDCVDSNEASSSVSTGDCDDSRSDLSPAATETCDGEDDDCDGDIDEGVMTTYYADVDSDGFGDATSDTEDCSAPSGYVTDDQDCDDSDADINPDGEEVCDDVDNDCNGSVDDDATDADTWYEDADSDGYGNYTESTTACDQPSGYVTHSTDCDDTVSLDYPGATEYCDDSRDNDCDGSTDESGCTEYSSGGTDSGDSGTVDTADTGSSSTGDCVADGTCTVTVDCTLVSTTDGDELDIDITVDSSVSDLDIIMTGSGLSGVTPTEIVVLMDADQEQRDVTWQGVATTHAVDGMTPGGFSVFFGSDTDSDSVWDNTARITAGVTEVTGDCSVQETNGHLRVSVDE